jgi:hypothetical protein
MKKTVISFFIISMLNVFAEEKKSSHFIFNHTDNSQIIVEQSDVASKQVIYFASQGHPTHLP